VTGITGDAWNYGNGMGSGSISLSAGSETINQTALGGLSGFSLETGPVAD